MTPELQHAFEESKTSLCQATLLTHPVMKAELALFTDASDVAIGAVLQQRRNGELSVKKIITVTEKIQPL